MGMPRVTAIRQGEPTEMVEQFAALPYVMIGGRTVVCLATSRETRRWIIPKGWPKKKLARHVLAAQEAMEEAGLIGEISPAPLGTYSYWKRLPAAAPILSRVIVYPLLVTAQSLDWPERKERELRWLPSVEAAKLVEEPELAELMAALDSMWLRHD